MLPCATVWLTGLPSAGKSTIAHGCEAVLRGHGLRVEVLDGDAVRPHLAAARGYSREDRAISIRRIGWVAELLARNGVLVLVSFTLFPCEQVLLIRYRELRDAPVETVDRVCRFLGVETGVVTEVPRHNVRPDVSGRTSGVSVAERAAALLRVDDVPRVAELTGWDLAEWLR